MPISGAIQCPTLHPNTLRAGTHSTAASHQTLFPFEIDCKMAETFSSKALAANILFNVFFGFDSANLAFM